jgi:hypothetical protein
MNRLVPRWCDGDRLVVGLVLILALWECTFTAFDALAVSLPGLGSVTLADLSLAALAGLYAYRALATARFQPWTAPDRWALFLLSWILLAALANIWWGTLPVTLFLRYTVRLALLWTVFSLVRRLGPAATRHLVGGLVVLGALVCVIHTAIILTQRTDLLQELYYAYSRSQHRFEYDQLASALNTEFASNWPGGGLLMSSLAVGALCGVLTARTSRQLGWWGGCLLVASAALLVALSRSRLVVLWGVIPLVLVWRTPLRQFRFYRRLAWLGVIGVTSAAAVLLVAPGLQAAVTGKFALLSDTSDASFTMRQYDTRAALAECLASPVLGTGVPEVSRSESLFGGDTHGALALVLAAGAPALLGLVAFCGSVWRRGRHRRDALGFALGAIYLHMLLLFALNVETLVVYARGLIPFVVVTALLTQLPPGPARRPA